MYQNAVEQLNLGLIKALHGNHQYTENISIKILSDESTETHQGGLEMLSACQ